MTPHEAPTADDETWVVSARAARARRRPHPAAAGLVAGATLGFLAVYGAAAVAVAWGAVTAPAVVRVVDAVRTILSYAAVVMAGESAVRAIRRSRR